MQPALELKGVAVVYTSVCYRRRSLTVKTRCTKVFI